jgi:RNA polymerase sigma factor for flagellar operon FliA
MLPDPHANSTANQPIQPPKASDTTTKPAKANPSGEALTEHMHLVHKVVAHFVRRLPSSVQREDLIAAGSLGLFFALRSSTHTCEEMFASYARIRIRGAIVDELRRHDWSPRRRRTEPARTDAPASGTFRTAEGEGGNANATLTANSPASAAPSNVHSLEHARVRAGAANGGSAAMTRLPAGPEPERPRADAPVRVAVVGFDDLPPHQMQLALGELDGDVRGSPLDEVENKRSREELHAAVALLATRERAIIRMRYFEAMPSKAIASALGLSEARVSQLHARATARLKEILDANGEQVGLAA